MGNRDSIMRSFNLTHVDHDSHPLKTANLPIIFILGGPGAGKGEPHPVGYSREGEAIISRYWLPQGTQCEKIVKKYRFLHISSGDLLREEVTAHTARGIIIDRLMAEGKLVPTNIILDLIKDKMTNALSTTKGFVLDGFPHDKIQGKQFDKEIHPPDLVIYLKVDEKILKERLQGRAITSGRKDDNDEAISLRIKLFMQKNNQLLKHYDKKLTIIDADNDVENVFNNVCDVIDKNIGDYMKYEKAE